MDQEHDIQESLQMQTAVSIMENKENLTDEQLRTLATDAECRSHCEMLEDVSRILNAQKMTLPDVEEEWNKFKNRERISEGKEQKEDIRNGLPVRSPRVTPIYIYLAAAAAILAVIMLIPWKKAEIKDVVTASADSGRVTTIIEATQELEGITITSGHKTYTIENQETSTQSILAQLSKEDKETLQMLTESGGTYDAIEQIAPRITDEGAKEALSNLKEILDIMERYGFLKYVSVDLGLIESSDYYTGMVFKGYTYEVGFPIFAGGRYDDVAKSFGKEIEAVGFSISLTLSITALMRQEKFVPAAGAKVIVGGDFEAATVTAEALRAEGTPVIIDTTGMDEEALENYAKEKGIETVMYMNGGNA